MSSQTPTAIPTSRANGGEHQNGSLPAGPLITKAPWKYWMDAIVYQIWPASFQDSNGDGIGDLAGITSRLDYIKALGVNAIWISPMYESPQADMGYDVSNYNAIHAPYGTMEDFEELISGCHARGLRILCDLVINHTSDQHAWFKASRSSKDDPKRDWYIWRPAKYDAEGKRHPPNNWRSFFSESAWQWDEHTQEYYLHLFAVGQPDLNWSNDACRAAIIESAVVFWLGKGIDGFRIDTAALYSKRMDFADAPVVEPGADHQPAEERFSDGPMLETYLRELGATFAKYDAMTVGEFGGCPLSRSVRATSASDPQMSMNFHFGVCDFGRKPEDRMEREALKDCRLSQLKRVINEVQTHTEGTDSWPTFFLENHDQPRSISRYAHDSPQWRVASGKMLACVMASMSGTLYLYQGQEVGQVNFSAEWPLEEYKDLNSLNYVELREHQGEGEGEGGRGCDQNGASAATSAKLKAKAMAGLAAFARDHARTPVQWSAARHAGFTTKDEGPWMRVADEYTSINVEASERDAGSVLHFYRRALALRAEHIDVLGHGLFRLWDADNDETMVYAKVGRGDRLAVVMVNFTTEEQVVGSLPPEADGRELQLVLGTVVGGEETAAGGGESPQCPLVLAPLEGRIYLA